MNEFEAAASKNFLDLRLKLKEAELLAKQAEEILDAIPEDERNSKSGKDARRDFNEKFSRQTWLDDCVYGFRDALKRIARNKKRAKDMTISQWRLTAQQKVKAFNAGLSLGDCVRAWEAGITFEEVLEGIQIGTLKEYMDARKLGISHAELREVFISGYQVYIYVNSRVCGTSHADLVSEYVRLLADAPEHAASTEARKTPKADKRR